MAKILLRKNLKDIFNSKAASYNHLTAKVLICAIVALSSQLSAVVEADRLTTNSRIFDWPMTPGETERIRCLDISFAVKESLKNAVGCKKEDELDEQAKKTFKERSCMCDLSVDKKGTITNLKIFKSSGLADVDQFAMNLIRQAAPIKSADGTSFRCVVYLPFTLVRSYRDAISPWQGVP